MKYFIGNWKMFGVPKSIKILNKINLYHLRDKNANKYRVIITPPYTLIQSYSKNLIIKRFIYRRSKLLSKRPIFLKYSCYQSVYVKKCWSKIQF